MVMILHPLLIDVHTQHHHHLHTILCTRRAVVVFEPIKKPTAKLSSVFQGNRTQNARSNDILSVGAPNTKLTQVDTQISFSLSSTLFVSFRSTVHVLFCTLEWRDNSK
jgi:hypothetical protein